MSQLVRCPSRSKKFSADLSFVESDTPALTLDGSVASELGQTAVVSLLCQADFGCDLSQRPPEFHLARARWQRKQQMMQDAFFCRPDCPQLHQGPSAVKLMRHTSADQLREGAERSLSTQSGRSENGQ